MEKWEPCLRLNVAHGGMTCRAYNGLRNWVTCSQNVIFNVEDEHWLCQMSWALFQVQGKSGGFSLSGMKTKLFGGDTPEQREQKIKLLEEQIKESEEQVRQTTEEAQWVVFDVSYSLNCSLTSFLGLWNVMWIIQLWIYFYFLHLKTIIRSSFDWWDIKLTSHSFLFPHSISSKILTKIWHL